MWRANILPGFLLELLRFVEVPPAVSDWCVCVCVCCGEYTSDLSLVHSWVDSSNADRFSVSCCRSRQDISMSTSEDEGSTLRRGTPPWLWRMWNDKLKRMNRRPLLILIEASAPSAVCIDSSWTFEIRVHSVLSSLHCTGAPWRWEHWSQDLLDTLCPSGCSEEGRGSPVSPACPLPLC